MIRKIAIADRFKHNFLFQLYKTHIIDSILIVKNHGFKELLKRKGWKFLVVIFSYYLIRDLTIYVVIPLLITRGIIK